MFTTSRHDQYTLRTYLLRNRDISFSYLEAFWTDRGIRMFYQYIVVMSARSIFLSNQRSADSTLLLRQSFNCTEMRRNEESMKSRGCGAPAMPYGGKRR